MTAYRVQKLLFHVNSDAEIRARFYGDGREALMDAYRITDEERVFLDTVDVGALYAMGVHPQFLAPYAGRAGIAWKDYLHAMENPGPLVGEAAA